ncbi:SAM-dependent methyltransferase [Crocinitomix catalasitica]|uniref:SAM-dependent methyltransferase n=1 Tax=Crocinitomix catalasitica TaxID=184607 RepID=UPI00047F3EA7|nr:SAM-dependent methyltransferase [Crocinitomix catalasitica]
MSQGKLFIIPIPISDTALDNVLPSLNHELVGPLRIFVVEKIKTARQFLRKMDATFPIDDSVFYEQDKHNDYEFELEIHQLMKEGKDIGLLSEAGYPGIADPGAKIVALAHKNNMKVVPLVGPSSIFLALAASGMNGQGFTFNGYLAKKDPERTSEIKQLVQRIAKTGFAEIFIETPYRNVSLMEDLIRMCPGEILLTIAYDITGDKERIQTKPIELWAKKPFPFDKTPCVFVLGRT